jgi:hypothetical protein
MDVAQAMQGAGLLSKEDIIHGEFNPMRKVGAAKAADIRHFGGSFSDKTTEKRKEVVAGAEEETYATIGRIFQRLRELVKKPSSDILEGPGGADLSRLAAAFDQWMNAKFPPNAAERPDAEVKRQAAILHGELYLFLKTFNK